MNHFWVLINFIILLIGMWLIFYCYQMEKNYSYPFLKPLLYFLVFSNLIVLVSLFTYYCCAAMFGNCLLYRSTIYLDAIHPFGLLFLIGRTIAFIWLVMAIQNITIPTKLKKYVVYGLTILAIFYLLKYVLPFQSFIYDNLIVFNRFVYLLFTILFHSALLYILVYGFSIRRNTKRMILSFGLFFLIGHIILLLSRFISGNERFLVVFSILLLFNIFPLVWFKYYFLPFHTKTLKIPAQINNIETIYEKHKISKREKEIVDLILEGKSNKEIQSMLYISLHTVKNHIYSLYQKLGVKSRGQLVYLILESKRRS